MSDSEIVYRAAKANGLDDLKNIYTVYITYDSTAGKYIWRMIEKSFDVNNTSDSGKTIHEYKMELETGKLISKT